MVPAIVFSIDIDIISYHAPGYGSQNGEGSNSSVSTISIQPVPIFFSKIIKNRVIDIDSNENNADVAVAQCEWQCGTSGLCIHGSRARRCNYRILI